MRVALAFVACLALIAACQGATPTSAPSPSLQLTDLSSVRLLTPNPNATLPASTPRPTSTPAPTPTSEPSATSIELGPTPTATPMATGTTAATPSPASSPLAFATPAADCVNGWMTPAAGSAENDAALEMINAKLGTTSDWTVEEIRYFTGPDVPWIIEPHYDVVDYWYVKASTEGGTVAARFLIEQRTQEIRDVTAVAPFDTTGYKSPDWTAFVGDGTPTVYAGLPGAWSGVPYDFVTGEGDSGQPGLPVEVVGCLAGT